MPHNETLESDLLRDPDNRTAYHAYAHWLRSANHPLGELIEAQLIAESEPKRLRKLKLQANQLLTRYIQQHLVPRYRRLEQRLLAFKLGDENEGTDGIGGGRSESVVWRHGLITSIETWCWTKPMRAQALELLRDPHTWLLRNLCLRKQRVDDLGIVSHLRALEDLDFHWADIGAVSDLSPLASLTRLYRLDVGGAPVTDLSPLRALPLKKLTLTRTTVVDLTPLTGHATLECLEVAQTSVADATPLLTCRRLCSVNLWDTHVPKTQVEKLKQSMKANRAEPSPNADYEPSLSHPDVNWYED